jgi:hypothetical protein
MSRFAVLYVNSVSAESHLALFGSSLEKEKILLGELFPQPPLARFGVKPVLCNLEQRLTIFWGKNGSIRSCSLSTLY